MSITCKICGEVEHGKFIDKVQNVLEKEQICYTCYFWKEQMEKDKEHPNDFAIINGEHYRIGDENDKGYFRGFGGRKFKIRFHDGRERVTTNLWCQGDIPHEFREKFMPDNAIFIN